MGNFGHYLTTSKHYEAREQTLACAIYEMTCSYNEITCIGYILKCYVHARKMYNVMCCWTDLIAIILYKLVCKFDKTGNGFLYYVHISIDSNYWYILTLKHFSFYHFHLQNRLQVGLSILYFHFYKSLPFLTAKREMTLPKTKMERKLS